MEALQWALAQVSTDGLPPWLAGGTVSALLGGMWWAERGERKESNQRERQLTERVLAAVEVLSRAVDALERREARRRT